MLRDQKGFTLIEIIAVLVILGILAAVAIPKFLDLQNDARKANARGAIAALQSSLSMGYSQYLLNLTGTNTPTDPAAACDKVSFDPADKYSGKDCGSGSWLDASAGLTLGIAYEGVTAGGVWTTP